MVPNFMPTLLSLSACAVVAMLVLFSVPLATYFSSLCSGFVLFSTSLVQTKLIAALRLFGVSTTLNSVLIRILCFFKTTHAGCYL
jgi:hypothetical protein